MSRSFVSKAILSWIYSSTTLLCVSLEMPSLQKMVLLLQWCDTLFYSKMWMFLYKKATQKNVFLLSAKTVYAAPFLSSMMPFLCLLSGQNLSLGQSPTFHLIMHIFLFTPPFLVRLDKWYNTSCFSFSLTIKICHTN
jgi:hypothetical protein